MKSFAAEFFQLSPTFVELFMGGSPWKLITNFMQFFSRNFLR